jgi:hypothetical protein
VSKDANQDWLKEQLNRNNSKRFVQRILLPDRAPVAPDDEDPKRVMTHKMAWGEADGKYYVYPTVMEDTEGNGALRNYGKDAFQEALRRRDFIVFDKPEDADKFSRTYKSYWDAIGYKPELKP